MIQFTRLRHTTGRKYLETQYRSAIASRGPYQYETRTAFKGDTVYLQTTLIPVFGQNNVCTHLIDFSKDVTKQERES